MKKFWVVIFLLSLATPPVWGFSDGNVLERGQFGFGLTAGYKRFTASGPGGSINVDFYRFYPDAGFGYKSFIGPTEIRLGLGCSQYNLNGISGGSPVSWSKGGLAVALSSANKVIKEKTGLPGVSIEGILDFSFFSGESIYFYGLAVIVNKHFGRWNLFAEPGLFMFSFGDNSKFDARLGGGLSYELSPIISIKTAVDYDLGDYSGLQFKACLSYNLPLPEMIESEEGEPTGYYADAGAAAAPAGGPIWSVEPRAALPGETLILKVKVPKGTEIVSASAELGPGKNIALTRSAGDQTWSATHQLPLDAPRGNYSATFRLKTGSGEILSQKVPYQVE